MIAEGAVSGEITNHIQKPFLCLGGRLFTRERKGGRGGRTDGRRGHQRYIAKMDEGLERTVLWKW